MSGDPKHKWTKCPRKVRPALRPDGAPQPLGCVLIVTFQTCVEPVEFDLLVAHHPDGRLAPHQLLELEPDVGRPGLVAILQEATPLVLAHA